MDNVTTSRRTRPLAATVVKNTAIGRTSRLGDNAPTKPAATKGATGGISKTTRGAFADVTNAKTANVRRPASKAASNAAAAVIGTLKPDTAIQTTNAATNRRAKAAGKVAQTTKKAAAPEPKVAKAEVEANVYVPAQPEATFVHPLDIKDMENHLMAGEYAPEIFAYMREMESRLMPKSNYMDEQPNIEWRFRRILVDWMVSIHDRFGLHPETLFLAVNIVDRFLSQCPCVAEKLQVIGIAAILIASKYEEQYTPPVQNFVMMANGAFSDKEVLRWERNILYVLEFELGWPSPTHFLRRVSKAENYCLETRTIAKFFLEIALMDERLIGYPPSKIAAASLWIARRICQKGGWTADLSYFSGYSNDDLIKCAQKLIAYLEENIPFKNSQFKAVFRKYEKLMRVTTVVENWMMKEMQRLKVMHANLRQ
jgi:G2/mitotic-specific cyclin 1/2